MKFWSKVEFACHFGKIHPPLQYIEIHLSWWFFQLAAILDCPLPYSPIWWIQFQFDPWRFANFIAIRSWNKGCNGRITWKAPLGCRIDASPLPWIDIHILHQTIDVDDKNPAPVDKVISLFKAVDASQFIQDVFHQQCGPSHLFLKTAVALSSTWVSNSRNLLVFQHLNAFGSPNTWNSFHHVGYCKITSFFQVFLGPLRFNATFLPEKKKTYHIMTARNKQRHLGNGTSKDHLATTQGRSSTLQNLTIQEKFGRKIVDSAAESLWFLGGKRESNPSQLVLVSPEIVSKKKSQVTSLRDGLCWR